MTGAFAGRDGHEVDALVTDRYLDALLAAHARGADRGPSPSTPDDPVRRAADRLARDLPRLHPSFLFEEALAGRLAAVAARMGASAAAGGADRLVGLREIGSGRPVRRARCPSRAPPSAPDRRRPDLGRAVARRGRLRRLAVQSPGRRPDGPRRPGRGPVEADLMPIKLPSFRARRDVYPADLWTKCPSCETMLFNKQLDKALRVCPTCGHHFRLSAVTRLAQLLDPGTWSERDAGLLSVDRLGFVDQKPYPDRLEAAQTATGMRDAAVWGMGAIGGRRVAICVMDFGFMGGSMGAVVGEKVTRAAEAALDSRLPLIVVSASGGARMQEGTLALMQLAKTLAALERLRAAGVPFLSVLSDPTTGGVFASFASVGDVNIAEPDALIGFAGSRVSAGTIAQELPVGFQRSEFLFDHGFIDRVVARPALRDELAHLLDLLPVRVPDDGAVNGTLDIETAGFRPFSFLSSLAERVAERAPTRRRAGATHRHAPGRATHATRSGRASSSRGTWPARGPSSSPPR